MLLEVAKERQQGEENQERKKQWKSRGGGRCPALQAAHEKRKFIFKYDKTMAKASSGGFVVARRGGEGGNEGEMM